MVKYFLYAFMLAFGVMLALRLLPKTNTVCGVAGKSGGHIIPGITLIEKYLNEHPESHVLFFSTNTPLDKTIVAGYSFVDTYVPLNLDNFPGNKYTRYPSFTAQCAGAFCKSLFYLAVQRPQKVVSMGGYVSLPVCWAAWILGIPVELYELNAVPGKAVLWLSFLARKIYVCFPQAKHYFSQEKVEVASYPFRFKPEQKLTKQEACAQLGLNAHNTILLVLGGSQGSSFINTLIPEFFEQFPDLGKTISLIHQAGSYDLQVLKQAYAKHKLQALVFDYRSDLDVCYAAADIIIARAGAGTLFEILFFKKPAFIIPLQTATTAHQKDNAYALQELHQELFFVVEQSYVEEHKETFFNQLKDRLAQLQHADYRAQLVDRSDHLP